MAALLMESKNYITPRKYNQLPEIEQLWHKLKTETQSPTHPGVAAAAAAANLVTGPFGVVGIMFLCLRRDVSESCSFPHKAFFASSAVKS